MHIQSNVKLKNILTLFQVLFLKKINVFLKVNQYDLSFP